MFDNEYPDYDGRCIILDREINRIDFDNFPIPDDCPFPKTKEKPTTYRDLHN